MLTDLQTAKMWLRLTSSDISWDGFIDLAIRAVSESITRWIGYSILTETTIEYLSGNGAEALVLRRRPLMSVQDVWLDPSGFFGNNPTGFAAASRLLVVKDYSYRVGKSGLLFRLGGGSFNGYWPIGTRTLTPHRGGLVWPTGTGNIKVQYTAGYLLTPPDIEQVALTMIAKLKATGPNGGERIQSESLGDYSYTLGSLTTNSYNALADAPEFGSARSVLAPYREFNL